MVYVVAYSDTCTGKSVLRTEKTSPIPNFNLAPVDTASSVSPGLLNYVSDSYSCLSSRQPGRQ